MNSLKELLRKYRLLLIDSLSTRLEVTAQAPELAGLVDALGEATESLSSFTRFLNRARPAPTLIYKLREALPRFFNSRGRGYDWKDFFYSVSRAIDDYLSTTPLEEEITGSASTLSPIETLVRRGCALFQCEFGACLTGRKENGEIFFQMEAQRLLRELPDIAETIESSAALMFASTPLLQETLESGSVAAVHDAIMDVRYEEEYVLLGLRSLLFIPLHNDTRQCAVLVFGDMTAGYFDELQIRAENYAKHAQEIFRTTYLHPEQDRFDHYCNNLAANLDPAQSIKLFVTEAAHLLAATVAAFYRPGSDQKDSKIMLLESEVRNATGLQGCDLIISADDAAISGALRQKRLLRFDQLHTLVDAPSLIKRLHNRFQATSGLLLPVTAESRTIGLFVAASQQSWNESALKELERYAKQLAPAVASGEKLRDLKKQNQRWAATFNAISDPVVILDKKKYVVTANEAASSFFSRPVGMLQGADSADLHPIFRETQNLLANVISSGESRQYEKVYDERFLLLSADPIGTAESRTGAVCILRDLTELRRSEETAQNQRLFFINLIENAYDAIFTLDRQGHFTLANSRMQGLTGLKLDELIGRKITEFLAEGQSEAEKTFEMVVLGRPQKCEAWFRNSLGELRATILSFSPLFNAGQLSGVLGIARDITEEKQAAEVAAHSDKLHAIGQMASGVAHDFNNVLATILGRAQILKKLSDNEQLRRGLEIIETAALDGAHTARRIQNFSRLNQELHLTSVDVNEIVQDCLDLTSSRWREDALAKGISYKIETSLNPGATVLADPSELREVFVNLLFNALDAMPTGGIIHITTCSGDGQVAIAFTDTGTGMTEEVKSKIFEPFFTTKGRAGTGLGLSVSMSIISRFGGRIEVDSNLGEGTTFTIVLPYHQPEPQVLKDSEPIKPSVNSCKILVIDDEDTVREVLSDMLELEGHVVVQAANGAEGLDILSKERFNIVFTDLVLPDMDGWKLASRIKQQRGDTRVVLVTGYGAEIAKDRMNLVDLVFHKPFQIEALRDALETLSKTC